MKNKFDILNDVKIDIDEYEEIKFENNDDLKRKMNNKIRKNKTHYKKSIAVASLVLVLGSGVLVNDKVWANLEEIWYSLNDIINMKKDQVDDYKYDVNKVAEDKNVKITFNNIMIDEATLIMDLDVDYSEFDPFKDFTKKQQKDWQIAKWGNDETRLTVGTMNEVYVDGIKLIGNQGGPGEHKEKDGKVINVIMEQGMERIESDNSEATNWGMISKDKFPYVIDKDKVYNFKIKIKELYLSQKYESVKIEGIPYTGTIEGNWEVNLDIKGKDLVNASKSYKINKVIDCPQQTEDAKLELQEIRISPLYIIMNYKYSGMNSVLTENIKFKITNEKNEEVVLGITSLNRITGQVKAECRNRLSNINDLKITPFITDNEGNIKEILNDKTINIDAED